MNADWFYSGAVQMWPGLTEGEFGEIAREVVKRIGDQRWSLERMSNELVKELTLRKGPPA
jgi:hypothetical protein